MREIPLERIGTYLKTAIEILHENGDYLPSRDLVKVMEKRLVPFTKFESGNYGENRVRWTIVFRFWTIGLVKGGYIKKSKRIWYLTQKGQELIGLKPIELTKISSHEYAKRRRYFISRCNGRIHHAFRKHENQTITNIF